MSIAGRIGRRQQFLGLSTSACCSHQRRNERGFLSSPWFPDKIHRQQDGSWRLQTLAIETSCDDTSVAILSVSGDGAHADTRTSRAKSTVLFHEKITASSAGYGGIHPIVALESHQESLGPLLERALGQANESSTSVDGHRREPWQPDFVSVTRGPGMRSNLSVGLDTAKGLALAWGVPVVGVHHMQAHALTPRLCYTLRSSLDSSRVCTRADAGKTLEWSPQSISPAFPFLSVLASGGHTMLIDSQSLTEHKTLAETADIAIGDCLDKAARIILPSELLIAPYGKALEECAFPDGPESYIKDYRPPARRGDEIERRSTEWGWSIGPPLAESAGYGKSSRRMIYSFAGIVTAVQRIVAANSNPSIDERRTLASETLRIAFEHLASRIFLQLSSLTPTEREKMKTIVVSGGVASNQFLRHVLRSILDIRGFSRVQLEFPPSELCTDNALMIAWAGMEMYCAGWESHLNIRPIRKWSMDSNVNGGGILDVGGWRGREVKDSQYSSSLE